MTTVNAGHENISRSTMASSRPTERRRNKTIDAPPTRAPRTVGIDVKPQDGAWRVTTTTATRSEEHTSELQSLMRISYAVFCLNKKKSKKKKNITNHRNKIRLR